MKETLRRLDVWCKIVLLLLFVLLYGMARSYPVESRQFPQLIAVFTLVILVVSLIRDFSGKTVFTNESAEASDAGFQATDQKKSRKERRKRFYLAWGMILISTAIGFWGGFLITTFLLFMGFAMFFGEKKHLLRNSLTSITVTVVIYFVFEWFMKIPLLGN